MKSFRRKSGPYIYVITDGTAFNENFSKDISRIVRLVTDAVDEGVSLIQIREKRLHSRYLSALASACADVTRKSETALLINDRADVALASRADGVHLTSNSLSHRIVRQAFGPELIIGASAHSTGDIDLARRNGADFVVFGPLADTPRKGAAVGLEVLKNACSSADPFPVLGLGGINERNCLDIIKAGAAGVAGIRSFGDRASIRSLREALKGVSR